PGGRDRPVPPRGHHPARDLRANPFPHGGRTAVLPHPRPLSVLLVPAQPGAGARVRPTTDPVAGRPGPRRGAASPDPDRAGPLLGSSQPTLVPFQGPHDPPGRSDRCRQGAYLDGPAGVGSSRIPGPGSG